MWKYCGFCKRSHNTNVGCVAAMRPVGDHVEEAPKPRIRKAIKRHTLYRLYGESSDLLYIGITDSIGSRLAQHSGDKPWWIDVAWIGLDYYPDRESLKQAEREAIENEMPKYNVAYNPSPPARALPDVDEQYLVEWLGVR